MIKDLQEALRALAAKNQKTEAALGLACTKTSQAEERLQAAEGREASAVTDAQLTAGQIAELQRRLEQAESINLNLAQAALGSASTIASLAAAELQAAKVREEGAVSEARLKAGQIAQLQQRLSNRDERLQQVSACSQAMAAAADAEIAGLQLRISRLQVNLAEREEQAQAAAAQVQAQAQILGRAKIAYARLLAERAGLQQRVQQQQHHHHHQHQQLSLEKLLQQQTQAPPASRQGSPRTPSGPVLNARQPSSPSIPAQPARQQLELGADSTGKCPTCDPNSTR